MEDSEIAWTPTRLSRELSISVPYASQILKAVRTPPPAMAIRIFRKTGLRFGVLVGATDEEIDVLERFQGAA